MSKHPHFRSRRPNRAPVMPDFPVGSFESPAAAAIGRIEAGALDLKIERLVDEFIEHARANIGKPPFLDAELQPIWLAWKLAKKDMGVDPDTFLIIGKRARKAMESAHLLAEESAA